MRALGRSLAAAVLIGASVAAGAEAPARLDAQYRETANRILSAALTDDGAWDKLTYLCDHIGHRMSGSPALEQAVAWAAEQMKADGLENVRLQPVKVPHWVRGRESARVVEPIDKPLNMLGLGNSIGTPAAGITAPVVVVGNFEELDALGPSKVRGNIVLFDMPWEGYGRTRVYRTDGASRAAKLGAVAILIRSVTGVALYAPHTGSVTYTSEGKIPAAALTVEDAAWIRQMTAAGQRIQVRLQMEAQMLPDADSGNVMGEIRGGELPDEVVVLGGHIDSWDVGQGAHDDGAGVVAAWQAVMLMHQLGLRPRRTVRVIGWTNEENGARGGEAYRAALGDTVKKHVAAIEMDGGAERPVGFGVTIPGASPDSPQLKAAMDRAAQIGKLLDGIQAGAITSGGGGTDIGPLTTAGVPSMGLNTVGEHYFDWHHSNADTLDKVNLQDFRKCIAALAVMAYILADMPGTLGN